MNIRASTTQNPRVIAAITLVAALLFSGVSQAINIGEINLLSRLGEPLLAQVELTAASNEHIEANCLSLALPDLHEDQADSFLTRAKLSLKTDGLRQYVVIRTQNSFNELFAKVRLQIKCPNMGSISKTLTILPDIELPAAEIIPISGAVKEPDVVLTANTAPGTLAIKQTDDGASQSAAGPAQPGSSSSLHKSRKKLSGKITHALSPPQEQSAPRVRMAEKSPPFKLKLSGDPIDESRIGKISASERELLLAKQKLLDADDQMANFLALQHQVKQLQDELGDIKLKLAQMDSIPRAATQTDRPQASAAPVTPDIKAQAEIPPAPLKQPAVVEQSDGSILPRNLLIVLGLLLSGLLLWKFLRHGSQSKSLQASTSSLKHPGSSSDLPVISAADSAPPPAPPIPATRTLITAPAKPAPHQDEVAKSSPPTNEQKVISEEDAMLEEAELYAIHGHPNKAAEILREIATHNPGHEGAGVLLLSILSAQGKTSEFEKAARNFHTYNKHSESWNMIQALGRTLDPANPLYAGNSNLGAAAMFLPQIALNKRRPVGDILVEMGALSPQDMQNCLSNFAPKVHGRFGGYLISRKLITHAQLNEALVMQQAGNDGTSNSAMPSLQDMENLLADYDSNRDGSIGEYLVSRNLITSVQLDNVLRQHTPDETVNNQSAESTDQTTAEPPHDNAFDWDDHPEHDKLSRSRELTPPTAPPAPVKLSDLKLPDFELIPVHPSFPELDLNDPADKSGKNG